ncbi:MAG: NAD-dependent epimerase/dehydratase family protein [Dysgonamonadaceae bacterium]|nr:NAD-dependent epimerase/dehydratase family protein [Dysgonamonadaceae bacterium]
MTLLITGIHGFVGSNLVSSFKETHSIYGLDIISPEKDGIVKTFSWNDLEQIPTVDTIIHLAGKAHDTKNKSQSQVYFDINTGLTQKIFDYFLRSSATQFIFFSSVKAAADTVEGDCLTEDVIPHPVGPYGESKIKAEEYIQSALPPLPCGEGAEGRGVYILRPCMIHGPGNKGNLNLLYNVVSKGIPWPLGAFDNRRSFTSIDNLCYIVNGLLSKNIESGTYHIGDDEALSTNELIHIMCEATGKKPHIWKLNKGCMNACAKMGTALHLPLNTERLHKLTENYVVSNQKIKQALQIDKMPVTAKEGIMKTIQSF